MSQASPLQQALKLVGLATADKETVGIVAVRQFYAPRGDSCGAQTLPQSLCLLLTTAIGIGIQGQVHCAALSLTRVVRTQLAELQRIQVTPQGAGDVVESGLPEHGQIEHSLHQNDLRASSDLLPGVQASLASGQE